MERDTITAMPLVDSRIVIEKGKPEMFSPKDFLVLTTDTEVVMASFGFSGERLNGNENEYINNLNKMLVRSLLAMSNPKEKVTCHLYSANCIDAKPEDGGLDLKLDKPVKMTIEEFKNTHAGKTPSEFIEDMRCKDN